MTPLDRLFAKIDPLFATPPFDPTALPPGAPLPPSYRRALERRNGGYFYGGALHLFGACREPAFHSLGIWNAADGWRASFGPATGGLTFFAEDAFGDEFAFGASGRVFALRAESGRVEELADDFDQWLSMAVEAPDELLSRGTFARWVQAHGHLPRGSQLQAYPPYLFAEDPDRVQLDAVDAFDNMAFHAALAETLANLPEGSRVKLDFTDEGIQITTEEIPPEERQGNP